MALNTQAMTPEFFLRLGSGLLSGRTVGEQLGNASDNVSGVLASQKEQAAANDVKNKTAQMLEVEAPDIAVAVRNGALTATDGYKQYLERKAASEKAKQPDYMAVKGLLFNKKTGEWLSPPADMAAADNPPEYGLNPQYGVDADGNPVLLQLSKDGKSTQTPLPDGVSLSKTPIKLDAGTHFVLLDPITRRPVGTVPKNVAEVEKQKVLGETEGKNIASAPADLQAGLNAKALVEELKADPNREMGTGWSGWLSNAIPATPGYDYQNKVDQAKSGAFLTAIQQLRGMGSLSNAEGDTATKAITRMNTATSEEAFLDALEEYERIVDQGIARAQSRLPKASDPATVPDVTGANTTSSGVTWKKK